jgi:hypothetical protein
MKTFIGGVLIGLVAGVVVGVVLPRPWQAQKPDAVIVQEVILREVHGLGEYDIHYPSPFTAVPNLFVKNLACDILEQRADGFRLKVVGWVSGQGAADIPPPGYEAKGVLAK